MPLRYAAGAPGSAHAAHGAVCTRRACPHPESGRRGSWTAISRAARDAICPRVEPPRARGRMSEELADIRTRLAMSKNAHVESGSAGVLHVLAGPVTGHLDRPTCEGLTTA